MVSNTYHSWALRSCIEYAEVIVKIHFYSISDFFREKSKIGLKAMASKCGSTIWDSPYTYYVSKRNGFVGIENEQHCIDAGSKSQKNNAEVI